MTTNVAAMPPARPAPREIPHTVSPGLWALAWKRLKSDHVGMVSLAIVVAFIVLMILSAAGLIASDWSKEIGVNYAPPSFIGADVEAGAPAAPAGAAPAPVPAGGVHVGRRRPARRRDRRAQGRAARGGPAPRPPRRAASRRSSTRSPT